MEPNFKEPVTRVDILNYIIEHFNYRSYLEIGVQGKYCWNQIKCDDKTGVEPVGVMNDDRIYSTTSDGFFKDNVKTFDCIFIDGDHNESQVTRDIDNALKFVNHKGMIVLHDAYPPSEEFTVPLRCGTVYRAIWNARNKHNIGIATYTGDFGVAVIRKKYNEGLISIPVNNYRSYIDNSSKIINSIDYFEDFKSQLSILFSDD